ncbi:uncharacterized protein I206_106551 [Kwoniella pini CBS 10737]|uniref:Uncharacterized protein n=1 Tax=Kwoniella pini CBS 10737 TaxID=1296096 RepID=A0A1B9HTV2_9TREE|nr:uncharacterized protein I206_07558 [Kwoniella pini CBS 10737]OCF46703.1 hypothetical protein I206_07558 [Kwoniella pini CBS 10737]
MSDEPNNSSSAPTITIGNDDEEVQVRAYLLHVKSQDSKNENKRYVPYFQPMYRAGNASTDSVPQTDRTNFVPIIHDRIPSLQKRNDLEGCPIVTEIEVKLDMLTGGENLITESIVREASTMLRGFKKSLDELAYVKEKLKKELEGVTNDRSFYDDVLSATITDKKEKAGLEKQLKRNEEAYADKFRSCKRAEAGLVGISTQFTKWFESNWKVFKDAEERSARQLLENMGNQALSDFEEVLEEDEEMIGDWKEYLEHKVKVRQAKAYFKLTELERAMVGHSISITQLHGDQPRKRTKEVKKRVDQARSDLAGASDESRQIETTFLKKFHDRYRFDTKAPNSASEWYSLLSNYTYNAQQIVPNENLDALGGIQFNEADASSTTVDSSSRIYTPGESEFGQEEQLPSEDVDKSILPQRTSIKSGGSTFCFKYGLDRPDIPKGTLVDSYNSGVKVPIESLYTSSGYGHK